MISLRDIAWLAGLLEGEGSFGYYRVKNSSARRPYIQLSMTDADVVERAARLLGVTASGPYAPRTSSTIPQALPHHRAVLADRRAVAWMMTLWPLMGERRRQKMAEVITAWSAPKVKQVRVPECGHPARRHCAQGKCRQCYHRDWYKEVRCARSS